MLAGGGRFVTNNIPISGWVHIFVVVIVTVQVWPDERESGRVFCVIYICSTLNGQSDASNTLVFTLSTTTDDS